MGLGEGLNIISVILKGGMGISTYQRGVQVQTTITRITTVIVITKFEPLTLIPDRIEAHISLPNNALLSIYALL